MLLLDSYQNFWNDRLLSFFRKFLPRKLVGYIRLLIIKIDTVIISLIARNRKARRTVKFPQLQNLEKIQVNYFDLGTHKDAQELNWIISNLFEKHKLDYKAFAFEALPSFYRQASETFRQNPRVRFFNMALCDEVPASGFIRLFTEGDGQGNSLYKQELLNSVEVPAMKFSDLLVQENIELKGCINIIRMNIEGAEYEVIQDITKNGLEKYFNGFYGMWDDVKKLPADKELHFRKLLKEKRINNFTFNGRDMKFESRKRIILSDIISVISEGPRII